MKHWLKTCAALVATFSFLSAPALAQEAPDTLVVRVSNEVLDAVRADPTIRSGDVARVMVLVDRQILPHVNFERMTASAVGRYWRQATPEQRQRLQSEFKQLLVRTYASALSQVGDQKIQARPMRAAADATEVVVRTDVRGSGEPIQIDYRVEKTSGGWKIYDVNVLGVWLVENYRVTFAQEISQHGIDGLISRLSERNRSLASRS